MSIRSERHSIDERQTDVLVVGAGAAGLRAAIAVHDAGARVLVVSKRARADAHTVLAAGGINAALGTMDPEDSWLVHAADTLVEGRLLGDPRAVEILCRDAPRAIEELVSYGARFARAADGRLLQRYFGAHRYRRTCFAGDVTGWTMIEALIAEIDRRDIEIVEGIYVADLLTSANRTTGVLGFRLDDGSLVLFQAGAIVLATGGHIHVYRRSSSRWRENTGDGMALAMRAGARLADMELIQFHPTGMVWPPEVEGTLVTEAVRGEGGRLSNARGERFMARYDPERLELSTRDRVALANYTEIVEGRGSAHGGVWLDVSHVPAATIRERLPRMVEQFQKYGIDITRDPMEVAPTGHYSMGGIRVDPADHWTGVPALFAAGEVTAGVHGANRLGGNSLLECIVFGRRAGEAAAAWAGAHAAEPFEEEVVQQGLARINAASRISPRESLQIIEALESTMWLNAGMVRDAAGLSNAIATIETYQTRHAVVRSVGEPSVEATVAALDLGSMLRTAEATVRSARLRTESRGAHQRRDFPASSPAWRRTIVASLKSERLVLSTEPLPEPSPEVAGAIARAAELAVAGRLLE